MPDLAATVLLHAIHQPFLLVRGDGTIAVANRAACRLLCVSEADLVDRRLDAFLGPMSEAIDAFLRRCLRSGDSILGGAIRASPAGEPQALRIDGSRFVAAQGAPPQALLRISPRDAADSRFSALNLRLAELGREVMRRQRAEDTLAAKIVEMEESDVQKDRFIAVLSHELRNPLAPIRAMLHVIRMDERPERVRHGVEVMERHLLHLIRLVDDLLDLSRIKSGKIRIQLVEASLADVLEMAASGVQARVDAKGQVLHVVARQRLMVRADPDRLRQVIGNLLDNAAKFTPEGGRISVTAAAEGPCAVIRVRDSGPGIAPELASRIFQFFAQGDGNVGRAHDGLGLGLALAKSLVELQGGNICLNPEIGDGAELVVTVPLAGDPPADRTGDAVPTSAGTNGCTSRSPVTSPDGA